MKEEQKDKAAPLSAVYRFADSIDCQVGCASSCPFPALPLSQLMGIGLLLALVQAVLPPFLWFFMGDFMTYGEWPFTMLYRLYPFSPFAVRNSKLTDRRNCNGWRILALSRMHPLEPSGMPGKWTLTGALSCRPNPCSTQCLAFRWPHFVLLLFK